MITPNRASHTTMDLRLEDPKKLYPTAIEIISTDRTPSGYIYDMRTYEGGIVKYSSRGEFKIWASTDEKFNRAMNSNQTKTYDDIG